MSNLGISEPPIRLRTLDALRGLATLLILLFHATDTFQRDLDQPFLLNIFSFADAGVEFFFVLSGFTLVWVYIDKLGKGGKGRAWCSFMLKRCLRIYPFYWVVTLCLTALYLLLPSLSTAYKRSFEVIVKSLLLMPQPLSPILAVAWFLSYIMLFYAIFGILIAFRPKTSLPIVTGWLILSIFFNIGVYTTGWGQQGERSSGYFWLSFLLSLYAIEFAAGGLMAFWLARHRPKQTWKRICLSYGILAFVVFGLIDDYVFNGANTAVMQGYEFITYGVAAVFLVGSIAASDREVVQLGRQPSGVVKWLLRLPKWLGAASYATFLTHYPVLSIGIKLLTKLNLSAIQLNLAGVLCCLLPCLVGWISYQYIERPLNRFILSGVSCWQRQLPLEP